MISQLYTAWKLSIFGVYLVQVQENTDQKNSECVILFAVLLPNDAITDFCVEEALLHIQENIFVST